MSICPETTEETLNFLRDALESDFYFRCLYEKYFTKVKNFFLRKKISPDDSLELTQEVFFTVYRSLESLRRVEDFEAWLYRISLNAFRNHLKKNKAGKRAGITVGLENEQEEITLLETIAADILTPLEELLTAEREQIFRRAMEAMPEQMRKVFFLKIVHEMTNGEIAAAAGISINTVKSHIFQARQKLREQFVERI